MKCVKCDKCGKIVDIDPRSSNMSMGNTVPEPFYKYGTLFKMYSIFNRVMSR